MAMARPHEEQKRTLSEDTAPQPEQITMRTDCIPPGNYPSDLLFSIGHPFTQVTGRVSVLVSVRFEIPCVSLHFAALRWMAKPLCLQAAGKAAARSDAVPRDRRRRAPIF
jgi:hypothetical protein